MPEATAPAAECELPVYDLTKYKKPLRTIEAVANSGLIKEEDRTPLQLLRRIVQALYGEGGGFPESVRGELAQIQGEFQKNLNTMPYRQLVESGHIHQLLNRYVALLVKANKENLDQLDHGTPAPTMDPATFNALHDAADDKKAKYCAEPESYNSDYMKQLIKDTALRFEPIVKAGRYLSMDEIMVASDFVHPDKEVARDLVSNVQTIQAALAVNAVANTMLDENTLKEYAADPGTHEVQIKALAKRVVQATRSLSSLRKLESTSPVLPLLELVSAQMHEVMKQNCDTKKMLEAEQKALAIVKSYEQAVYSLAVDFLKKGPSVDDKRTKKMLEHLENDIKAKNIVILPAEKAAARATELARKSAEELLQAANGNALFIDRITALAKAVGVTQPLQPVADLINAKPPRAQDGVPQMPVSQVTNNFFGISPETLANFAERLLVKSQNPDPFGLRK